MRKLYALLLVLGIIGLAFLFAYAFIPAAKAWMDTTLAPPIHGIFGGVFSAITGSYIWQTYITPPLNAFLIGMVCMIPIAWLWHKSFNRVRTVFVRSAVKESGQTIYTEPVSQSAPLPQAVTIKPEEEKAEAT
jgi:hypothetical protein